MSFKITAESDLWESRGTFTLGARSLSNERAHIKSAARLVNSGISNNDWYEQGVRVLRKCSRI
jgi:hypothetical protein